MVLVLIIRRVVGSYERLLVLTIKLDIRSCGNIGDHALAHSGLDHKVSRSADKVRPALASFA
jgi:hypothetical protein